MSKRRVLGKSNLSLDKTTNNILSKSQNVDLKSNQSENEFICPMCNLPISSLLKLNQHVDSVHLNIKDNANSLLLNSDIKDENITHKQHISKSSLSSITSSSSTNTNTNANTNTIIATTGPIKLPKDHFIRPFNGMKCSDHRCNIKIGLKHSAFNCSKCGKVYCSNHCNILLKLNLKLEIINQFSNDGIITKCCIQCLNEYKGWNDVIGNITIINKTKNFQNLRKFKNDENSLQNLILERRFDKIFNWIIMNYEKNLKITEINLKNFEIDLCNWKNDNDYKNCNICNILFGFFIRKHHCRICGDIVCGDLNRRCSMIVPLGIIFDLMKLDKLNDENKYEFDKIEKSLKNDYFGIRICLNCKKKILNKRVFKFDQIKLYENNDFLIIFKIWKLIFNKIENENISKIQNDDENLMLVGLFQRLDQLIKQIDSIINNHNKKLPNDEIKMFNTLKGAIANYIQIKLPILRKAQEEKLEREREVLQNLINDKPKLSSKDIRLKREKLMVLNEQKFVVSNLYEDFKKQRRFDDLKTLDLNLADIEKEIQDLTIELGDEGFH